MSPTNLPGSSLDLRDTAALGEAASEVNPLLKDVLAGLSFPDKSLPCKYLYDERGSAIFDQICELDEYYLTRTEAGIMSQHKCDFARRLGPKPVIVELGSGSSTKTRILLDSLDDLQAYLPVDISEEHLLRCAEQLTIEYPELAICPIAADFLEPFCMPDEYARSNAHVFFPGSTIGNLTEAEARQLLQSVAGLASGDGHACRPGLLIGFDLAKDTATLEAAYNDAAGVSAEFSLNLLRRLNRELNADFCLEDFVHVAEFNASASRIEIFLASQCAQVVSIDGREFSFEVGERIHIEYSHKYTIEQFQRLAESAGLESLETWTDPDDLFAVMFLACK